MTIAQCCQELAIAAERHASCPCQNHKTGSTVLWTGPSTVRRNSVISSKTCCTFKKLFIFLFVRVKIWFPSVLIKKKTTKKNRTLFCSLGKSLPDSWFPCTSSWHQHDPRGFWDLSLDLSRAGELHAGVSWKSSVSFCSFPELLLHEYLPHFVPLLHLLLTKKCADMQ